MISNFAALRLVSRSRVSSYTCNYLTQLASLCCGSCRTHPAPSNCGLLEQFTLRELQPRVNCLWLGPVEPSTYARVGLLLHSSNETLALVGSKLTPNPEMEMETFLSLVSLWGIWSKLSSSLQPANKTERRERSSRATLTATNDIFSYLQLV